MNKITSHLTKLGQLLLTAGLDDLSEEEKEKFWQQLQKFPLSLLHTQKSVLFSQKTASSCQLEPLKGCEVAGSLENQVRGQDAIRQGKVGCLILAGGQGTRLGFHGPKGTMAVSPVKGKSLFQIFAERTAATAAFANRPLHLAVMTSPLNHEQTVNFFEERELFGLPRSHLDFFMQSTLPFCDDNGNWLLERPGVVAEGPDGNGRALESFYKQGLWDKWRADGVEYLNVILVDNALADPFDAELIGFQIGAQADLVAKSVNRKSAEEKMGVIVESKGQIRVIEYSELAPEDFEALNEDGSLRFAAANTSLFSFDFDLIKRIATDPKIVLPLHLARKNIEIASQKVPVWKFETFIFDLLSYAKNPKVLLYPREKTYAPLKNASGEKSLETVKKAISAFDQKIYCFE